MASITNYATQDLFFPSDFHAEMVPALTSQKAGAHEPFPRQIDLWWFTVDVGARLDEFEAVDTANRVKFNSGGIFHEEPWRITHMELLALRRGGGEEIPPPATVVRFAHEYSAVGCRWVTDHLRGAPRPLQRLLLELGSLAPGATAALLTE